MKKAYTTISILIICVIFSCTTTKKTNSTNEIKSIQNITFQKDIKPIAEKFCGGGYCHHGSPSFWSKYENMKTIVDNGELHEEVIEKKTMPQGFTLPKKEYNLIKNWLKTGAKKQ